MQRSLPATPDALDPRRTAHSTFFALAAAALEKGGAMAMLLLLARLLGTEDFGRYAALMSLLAFFQIAAELGQEPILVRLLAQARGGRAALVQGALAMRLILASLAGLGLVPIAERVFPALGRGPVLIGAVALVAGSGAALRALFRTAQRLEWLCVTAAANVSAFGLALLVTHALGLGLTGAVAAWGAGQLAGSLVAAGLAATLVPLRPRWRGLVAARLARSGWPLALNALLLTVTLRVGQLIVLRMEGATAVGYLAAGSRLAEAFGLIPEALMLVLLPVLSAYEGEARHSQRRVSVRAVRYLAVLALGAIIVISITAPTLLGVLYGPAYVAGAPALRILVWLALLAASGTVVSNLLIAQGLERVLLAVNALASALTLGLSLIAVPRGGFVAAAAATLIASVGAQVVLVALPATRQAVAACLRPLLVPVLGGGVLALGGVAVAGPRAPIAAVALVLFVLFLVATRSVDAGDLALVRRAITRS